MTQVGRIYLKSEIFSGVAALEQLHSVTAQKVAVITDDFMAQSGMLSRVTDQLAHCQVTVFSDIVPDPPQDLVVKGTRVLAAAKPEILIALGGGSVIDAAKVVLVSLRKILNDEGLGLVAIPTTSGTGSEVTSYAVISDPEQGLKHALQGDAMVPDVVLLDPELVTTVPAHITADTGMDVITHALEAYVSLGANDFSDALAEKALELACEHLPQAFDDGSHMGARKSMHNASCLAGMAFNAAGLGVNHSLAHAIGGRFHIAHGRINAMLLPYVIAFNAGFDQPATDFPARARYATLARRFGYSGKTDLISVANLIEILRQLNERFDIPATLQQLGLDLSQQPAVEQELTQAVMDDTCTTTNPRQPSAGDVIRLINEVSG